MTSPSFAEAEELVYLTRALSATELIAARRLAFANGRVIEHDHRAVLTFGRAATLRLANGTSDEQALHHVTQWLARIAPQQPNDLPQDQTITPIAIGALAFHRDAPGELIVPEVAVLHEPGAATNVIVVGSPSSVAQQLADLAFSDANYDASSAEVDLDAPHRFELASVRSHDDFKTRVSDAVTAIAEGDLEKVVLAREVTVTANQPFRQGQLLERMRVLYPSCAAFAIDGFLGASPELLCRRSGAEVLSYPLAGTVPRSGDPEDDIRLANQLLHSAKDRAEHAYVVDMIAEELANYASEPVRIDGPHLLELRNVAHLATKLNTTLRPRHPDDTPATYPSALEIVGVLHPTPAVGGVPRDAALSYLDKFEELDRDRFAGPVGYVDANGDGEWWIGIRSAIVDGNTARLFAGVGIVASSEPQSELIETQLKLQALLATAVRP